MSGYLIFIAAVLVASAAIGAIYQFFFSVVALLARLFLSRRRALRHEMSPAATQVSFLILIPAHNEESGIAAVLECCGRCDYPKELLEVIVIADNCSDATARIVREYGIECWERFDEARRGKGEALVWGIPQALTRQRDAVMILDADSFLDTKALRECNAKLARGHNVIQVASLVSNPDESIRSYSLAIARILENDHSFGKSCLGLAATLMGSGMVFHRDILERFPWQQSGLCEDADYGFELLRHGVIPTFSDIGLVSPFPVTAQQLSVQRSRWFFGGLISMVRAITPLLKAGVARREWRIIDAAFSMFVTSRVLVMIHLFVTGIAVMAAQFLSPSCASTTLVATFAAIIFLYMVYVMIGILRIGLTRRRLALIWGLPLFVAHYLLIAATSLVRRPQNWNRTPR